MPMPRWWGQINKRVFNPLELKRGVRPVLTHVGRNSGKAYRTPLDAHRVDGGFVFILVYGAESDWVRNTLAAGHGSLSIDGEDVELANPRLVDEQEARQTLPDHAKLPPRLLGITEYLRMDLGSTCCPSRRGDLKASSSECGNLIRGDVSIFRRFEALAQRALREPASEGS
jgi:deazaflavin-dependent oxidoreductase (nitroreductase family)